MRQPYIAICVPSRDTVNAAFVQDLIAVIDDWKTQGGMCAFMTCQGTLLASQRHDLVLKARKEACTHILWIDSDMRFPRDLIERLLAHDEAVVGANCARRRMPTTPTAANYIDGKKVPVFTEEDSHGLERVGGLGTGVLLVSMEVYDNIPAPWFATPWSEEHKGYMGEDMYFCKLLRDCEVPIYVDHDVSREIRHIGEWEYSHEHVRAVREQREAEEAKAAEPLGLMVEA